MSDRKLTAPKRIGGQRLPLKIVSDVPVCETYINNPTSNRKLKEHTSVYKRGDNLDSIWCCRIGVDLWDGIFRVGRRFEPSNVVFVRHIAVIIIA